MKSQYKCTVNKEEITFDKLRNAGVNLIIFGAPTEPFSELEFNSL